MFWWLRWQVPFIQHSVSQVRSLRGNKRHWLTASPLILCKSYILHQWLLQCTAMQYSPPTPDFPLNLFSLSAIIAEEGEVHASIQIDEIFLMQPIREWFQTVCLILIFSISGPLKGKIWLLFQDHMSTTNVKNDRRNSEGMLWQKETKNRQTES